MQADLTRAQHERLVQAAESIALQAFRKDEDPWEAEVARRVGLMVGRELADRHNMRVAWCAYREKYADYVTGRSMDDGFDDDGGES